MNAIQELKKLILTEDPGYRRDLLDLWIHDWIVSISHTGTISKLELSMKNGDRYQGLVEENSIREIGWQVGIHTSFRDVEETEIARKITRTVYAIRPAKVLDNVDPTQSP